MIEGPDTIWAWTWELPVPSKANGKKEWADGRPIFTEAHGKTIARKYVAKEALTKAQEEIERLRGALEVFIDGPLDGEMVEPWIQNFQKIARAAIR